MSAPLPGGAAIRRSEAWQWSVRFLPGSNPGEQRGGTAGTFDQARAGFEAAWRVYLPKRSEADFQAWRDQRDWTAEKYRRLDRGEPDAAGLAGCELRPPKG